jgi:hypothetical protein
LEECDRNGEKLNPNSAIVRPKVVDKSSIRTVNTSDMIQDRLDVAANELRPREANQLLILAH